MVKEPSGKFVLRLSSKLHGTLKNIAARNGVSLNELCRRVMEDYAREGHLNLEVGSRGRQRWLEVLPELLADSLVGVVLFGSTTRGERRSDSDIDLLIVLVTGRPLTRRLYADWDEHLSKEPYSPHFVHLPERVEAAGSLWFEAALDGIVLYEVDRDISRFLGRIRRKIAGGGLVRRIAHGQPYWIRKQEDGKDVQ